MSTCARCGRVVGDGEGECYVSVAGDECEGALLPATVECREVELANLRSLLRSVTISLEQAAGHCEAGDSALAFTVIDGVLRRLS